MSLSLIERNRSPSQTSSGRSTPVPRVSRRVVEDDMIGADKGLRKYAVTIERALGSWEVSPQEWADYIAFLARLLKAIQSHPAGARVLPHSFDVASKLAQCLNPALPSGVHQKALEVYSYIFTTFGQGYLAAHLNEFLPGLTSVLSFASLSVRPALYDIYEEFMVQLPKIDLRPVLKSLILSLLPALEEETSEDFDRAFRILESLQKVFSPNSDELNPDPDKDGYFWQCTFLAVITSPSRRQGALNYLSHKLPKFVVSTASPLTNGKSISQNAVPQLSESVQLLLSPEPGLLVRCFAAGLSDLQVLIQRGFLDLLVTHIPLDSPVLRSQVREDDVDRLVTAALHVLLRREMSLNRRLWTWFLGPASSTDANGVQSRSTSASKQATESTTDRQYSYFMTYGKATLERCINAMFQKASRSAADAARPFRVCLSLMDRWEIGGSIVPHIFLPAMQNAYRFSLEASASDTSEVVRSASLFFDGVESMLIWANLLRLLRGHTSANDSDGLRMFAWIVQHFNIKDEEMTTTHIPLTVVYLLSLMSESSQSSGQEHSLQTVFLALLDVVPARAFLNPSTGVRKIRDYNVQAAPRELRGKIEEFYRTQNQVNADDTVLSPGEMAAILPRLSVDYAMKILGDKSDGQLSQALTLVIAIRMKIPHFPSDIMQDLCTAISSTLQSKSAMDDSWAFSDLSAIVAVVGELHRDHENHPSVTTLEPLLYSNLWGFLSPHRPKYHVEAVKVIWQLHDSTWSTGLTEASLTGLVRGEKADGVASSSDSIEAIRRFTVLWNHTVSQTTSIGGHTGTIRRRATLPNVQDVKQSSERERILITPLMLILDTLDNRSDPAFEIVRSWILDGSSLDRIVQIHFDFVQANEIAAVEHAADDARLLSRIPRDKLRNVDYILEHFLGLLRFANPRVWQCLSNTFRTSGSESAPRTGVTMIATLCLELITSDVLSSKSLRQKSLDILQILLSGPIAPSLRLLKIESNLLDYLIKSLAKTDGQAHGPVLTVITQALKLSSNDEDSTETASNESRTSLALKRPSLTDQLHTTGRPSTTSTQSPPPQLLSCLKLGFSSPSARPHLDQWLQFFLDVLPVFSEAIFANLIPLVECFCRELDKIHEDLISLSRVADKIQSTTPEAAALIMLDALEQILDLAHHRLIAEGPGDAEVKVVPQPRNVFSNMAAGVFKTDSLPSRTPQTNSRLTAILALQDTVRVSIKLWAWCSRYADLPDYDKSSNATTAYNALRIRNRTRHVLEQMFSAEELESLEVIIYTWSFSEASTKATVTLELIHAIPGLRPNNVMPAILDALCSRTNAAILPASRQSSQTLDLTALDVAWFLQAYLKSIEDDAMDEVWTDCMAFLRDVLGNPLPYRQVLPALLSMILLVAQKVDNTNFGEQRKMRRELGDVFLRLLTATLTTMSSASMESSLDDAGNQSGKGTNSAVGRHEMSLPAVLKEVTASIEIIMESQDRSTTAINSITTSVIAPLLRAKTFPENMTSDSLAVLQNVAKKSPTGKLWKRELADAFNDPRLLSCSPANMEQDWFPVFYQWTTNDRERMPELVSRLIAPSSAGIMFGVGASAARLEADRKAQLTLRRICVLVLASPQDTFVSQLRDMWEKMVELLEASTSSSPSAVVKSEVFMLCRALALSTSTIHLAPFWPIMNHSLQSAISSLISNAPSAQTFGNLALLQTCKLLDLLIALSPDDFQLHEWLYVSDTVDAVYQPTDWASSALSDQVAEQLSVDATEEGAGVVAPTPVSSASSGRRCPLIDNDASADKGDYKAMGRDDFARLVLRPFLSQLSIHAYEGVYRMEPIDLALWRHNLLQDLLDLHTIVE